jgi:hypothetical protein
MVDETKEILDKFTYACEGKHENFDEMMQDVYQNTDEVLEMIRNKHNNS